MPRLLAFLLLAAPIVAARLAADVNVRDTRLLHQPATNGTHVAFVYADDLWVARLDGSDVRRLTTDDGVESKPAFSPDGRQIAFSAQYDGNTDVFLLPVEGGAPRRLTWHPGRDEVQGFTPDGRAVLFTSGRASFTGRYTQLFTVAVDTGLEERLEIPNAAAADYSRDGRRIAYNPLPPASSSGSTIAAARCRESRSSIAAAAKKRKCRSRRHVPTTSRRCGLATRSTSSPTGTASSTCIRTTRARAA